MCGMIGTSAHLVIAKSHVHAPVQIDLDTLMYANAVIHALSG